MVTAARAGAIGVVTVRADYGHAVVAAARTGGARFSITARIDPEVSRAITQIPDDAWVPIKYAGEHRHAELRILASAEAIAVLIVGEEANRSPRAARRHWPGRLCRDHEAWTPPSTSRLS